jgi:hypothetical protein
MILNSSRFSHLLRSVVRAASVAAATILASPILAQETVAAAAILGEWRGESLCTNLALAPACKDEKIRYVFTAVKDTTPRFHLVAEKLVGGTYQRMYEIDLDHSPANNRWEHEFNTSQLKLRWEYRVEGPALSGVVVVRHSGEVLRKVTARRWRPR